VPFDETVIFVTCPECQSIFTPYQHMLFEISHGDVKERLSKDGLRLVDFYISIDRTQPKSFLKRSMKSILIGYMPKLAKRLFPSAGVSGFLAERIS
jgi:hypothetical protein